MDASYISSNQFSVDGSLTDEYVFGRRLRLIQGVDGIAYCTVYESTISGAYTVVTTKESEVTSNLTSATYGIIQPGVSGSLPEHSHDGDEGSGGVVEFTNLSGAPSSYDSGKYLKSTSAGSEWGTPTNTDTLVGLTDTPSSYDLGKYLKSTASGTEWATVSGGGSSDVQTLLDLEDTPSSYDSGKYLRSTASGTEWATVSGGGSSDVQDFLDLDDTPSSYDDGKYLVSTASGIDYFDLNIGSVSSDYRAYELVQEWNLDDETLDTTVSGLSGDTDDIMFLEWRFSGTDTSNSQLGLQMNGDDTVNIYTQSSLHEINNGVGGGYSDSLNLIYIGFAGVGEETSGYSRLYLKSGVHRSVITTEARFNNDSSDYHTRKKVSTWENSADEVTSLKFWTDYDITGYVRLYKFTQVDFPTVESAASAKGIQSVKVEYATDSDVYIDPGVVHINNGISDNYYQVSNQFTKSLTGLSADTTYYIYAKPPTTGSELSSSEIEYSTSSGVRNLSKRGYYHPDNDNWRCISVVFTDDSADIIHFSINNDTYVYMDPDWSSAVAPSTTWTTITVPGFPAWKGIGHFVAQVQKDAGGGGGYFRVRPAGSSATGMPVQRQDDNRDLNGFFMLEHNSSGQIEGQFSYATTSDVYVRCVGFKLPDEIYTGPASSITISGSGGTSDVQTFLDLTDTPSSYDDGKYLRSTTSGIEFVELNNVLSNHYGYELFQEITASSGTINTTISGIQGDIYDRWVIEFHCYNEYTTNTALRIRFNDDTANNYHRSYTGVDNGTGADGENDPSDCIQLGSVGTGESYSGRADLYIVSGRERMVNCSTNRSDQSFYDYVGYWTNSTSEVESINIYSTYELTGYVRLYRLTPISLPEPVGAKGVQSISIDYDSTTSGLNFYPGVIYINNGTNEHFYQLSTEFSDIPTLTSSDSWYYVYVNPAGQEITLSNIEYSTTAPTLDRSRAGYYHTTSSGWRCIGAYYSDDSNIMLPFDTRDSFVQFAELDTVDGTQTPSTTWTTSNLRVPAWKSTAQLTFQILDSINNRQLWVKEYNKTGDVHHIVGRQDDTLNQELVDFAMVHDENQAIKIRFSDTTTDGLSVRTNGFYLPDLIYNGPAPAQISVETAPIFVDRGDPSAWDFEVGDLTTDGNTHNLDLSSIVPAGAVAVLLQVVIRDGAANNYISFRRHKDTVNGYNRALIRTHAADVYNETERRIMLDDDRIIKYVASNTTFDTINLLVAGWWI